MAPIRIVLAEMPRLLHEIFAAEILASPDMEEIGGYATRESAEVLLRRGDASVVIVGLTDGQLPTMYGRMLCEIAGLRVFAIRNGGRSVWVHEMLPRSQSLGDLAPAAVLDAIRHEF
ncbi:MAG: hypothetical protein ACREND_13910 [Gemmatimonadaceae bacterium]